MTILMHLISSLIANPLSFLTSAAAIVVVFGAVIFFHEFGHFLVAKYSGVKVEEFAFGFGPKIFSFQWGETLYSLNWIPLGGFNKFQGEVEEDYTGPVLEGPGSHQDPNKDSTRDFMAQSWHRRILIAMAGPAMNYILAFLLFFGMLLMWGEPIQKNGTEVGELIAGMPADLAGIKPGDVVVKVQNEAVEDFLTMKEKIKVRADQETALLVNRQGKELVVNLVPKNQGGEGLIGIRPAAPIMDHKKISIVPSLQKSAWQCWNISAGTIYYLYFTIKEHVKPDVSGPLGITKVIADTAKKGLEDLIYLMAMISVAIGLFNLFPIPLLDGGHIVYYLIEGVRRKPLSQKVIGKANMVGMVLLLSLLVFATWNDAMRGKSAKKPAVAEQHK